jgi:hypothetical protein
LPVATQCEKPSRAPRDREEVGAERAALADDADRPMRGQSGSK